MRWTVEVGFKGGIADPSGRSLKKDVEDLKIEVDNVKTIQAYVIEGDVSEEQIKTICEELLTDVMIQRYSYFEAEGCENRLIDSGDAGSWLIEIRFNPGVTDAAGDSVKDAIAILGINGVKSVKTGSTYLIRSKTKLSEGQIETICKKCLANPIIQTYRYRTVQ
jgi:phosphoribosylformylglycinamidine synthase PurS subunit